MRAPRPSYVTGNFWRLFGYVRPYVWVFLLAVLLSAVVGVLEAVPMALLGAIVDALKLGASLPVAALPEGGNPVELVKHALPSGPRFWPVLAITLIAITLCKVTAEYAANLLMTRTGLKVVVKLRRQLYDHILR